MPDGRRTPRRNATNAKAAKARKVLSKPAPKPETPPDDEGAESEEEGGRRYVYESAEEGEEESAGEEEEDGEATDEVQDEDEEPQVVDLASDEEEESEGENREIPGRRKRVRTVVSDEEDDDVGPAPAEGPQSSHAAAPKKGVSTARASPAKQAAVKPASRSPSKKRKDDGKVAVKQEPAPTKPNAAPKQAAKPAPLGAAAGAGSSKSRSKKDKQLPEEAESAAADDDIAEGDPVTDALGAADETSCATGDKPDTGASKAVSPAPEAPRTPLRPTPKLKVRSPVMGGSDSGQSRRPTEGVVYEAEFTYHDHGLESLKFKEIVDGNVKLIHTGYKRQEGTITDALTDKMSDASRRREKVQARTSGPPRWEDTSDRDSWLFIRFVPVEDVTKEFVDREVANLQEKLDKAKQVFSATAIPKEYKQQKIRESWCYPYVVKCANEFAPHGTIKLEPWDVALTNKDIARYSSGPASVFPDEPPERIAGAGGFFSPESPYSLNDLAQGGGGGGLPYVSLG